MIVLHDSASTDLSHIQAISDLVEGFSLFDYVRIDQTDGNAWIGQIVQPNRNISTVGDRLDPTILHGLELMQNHSDVQSVNSIQVFDILILGEYDERQMLTPRLRPLPGAVVNRLERDDTIRVIGISAYSEDDNSSNVIGILLNADNVPLCINADKFNYHIMIAGGTGSGKSNAAANLIYQAARYNKCVLVHDAKPDYRLIGNPNTDENVTPLWDTFQEFHLQPQGATALSRIGFYGTCDPNQVDSVVGMRASDFSPTMLSGFFLKPPTDSELQIEGFASAVNTLNETRRSYSVDDILGLVEQRMDEENTDPRIHIHPSTGAAILRKVNNRRRQVPWLDAIDQVINGRNQNRLTSSRLDTPSQVVEEFDLERFVQPGSIISIEYSGMDEESYALILSYFLRICQDYRRQPGHEIGIVQLVDEAHRIFDNESRHSGTLAHSFARVMREGRSVDHSIILSLQNASQIPHRVMNNLNTKIVMRQNSKYEADAATQTMGREFSAESMRLGTGHALVSMHESIATVLAHMAPSPYELMRTDNVGSQSSVPQPQSSPTQLDHQSEPQTSMSAHPPYSADDDLPF